MAVLATHVPVIKDAQFPKDTTKDKLYVYPKVGDHFKNYPAMCNFLQVPDDLTHNSKLAQIGELKRFFDWEQVGQKITITKVYDTPFPKLEFRGRGQGLTPVQFLFSTILLYMIKYAPRDYDRLNYHEDYMNHEGKNKEGNCVSFSQTELRQVVFKMINKNYYSLRTTNEAKQNQIVSMIGGKWEDIMEMDSLVSHKLGSIIKTGLERLERESLIYRTKRFYIYYSDALVEDMLESGVAPVYERPASNEEIQMILEARLQAMEEFGLLTSQRIGERLNDKLIGDVNGFRERIEEDKEKIIDDAMISEFFGWRRAQEINKRALQILNKRDDINRIRGEKWVNVVDKMQLISVSEEGISRELQRRENALALMSMPGAQLNLNDFMIEWVGDRDEVRKSGNVLNLKEFADQFINFKKDETGYEWKSLKFDLDSNIVDGEMRFASNEMIFTADNLRDGVISRFEVSDKTPKLIAWNVFVHGSCDFICTNDPRAILLVREIVGENDAFPVYGYLGGIRYCMGTDDKTGEVKMSPEYSCFLFQVSGYLMGEIHDEYYEYYKNNESQSE